VSIDDLINFTPELRQTAIEAIQPYRWGPLFEPISLHEDGGTQGTILRQIKLQVAKPHPHRDTRLVRKLQNGNYLVAHEGDGAVREYDPTGKVVWDYAVPLFDRKRRGGHGLDAWGNQTFCAIRLPVNNLH